MMSRIAIHDKVIVPIVTAISRGEKIPVEAILDHMKNSDLTDRHHACGRVVNLVLETVRKNKLDHADQLMELVRVWGRYLPRELHDGMYQSAPIGGERAERILIELINLGMTLPPHVFQMYPNVRMYHVLSKS